MGTTMRPGLRSASQTSSERSLGRYGRAEGTADAEEDKKDERDADRGQGREGRESERERKSCNEDSTSIESDKAVCAAFNERIRPRSRSRPVHSTSTRYVLVTVFPSAYPLSAIRSIDKDRGRRKRKSERGSERERE